MRVVVSTGTGCPLGVKCAGWYRRKIRGTLLGEQADIVAGGSVRDLWRNDVCQDLGSLETV